MRRMKKRTLHEIFSDSRSSSSTIRTGPSNSSLLSIFSQEGELRRLESAFFGSSVSPTKLMQTARRAFVLKVLHAPSSTAPPVALRPLQLEEFEHAFLILVARSPEVLYIVPKAVLGASSNWERVVVEEAEQLCGDAEGEVLLVTRIAKIE